MRLDGIDAPEKGPGFGGKAKEALQALVGDGRVMVDATGTDRYGKTTARLRALRELHLVV
ncbi:hypothetical protein BH23VER1_BH23VER1_20940 [soil metagenome]